MGLLSDDLLDVAKATEATCEHHVLGFEIFQGLSCDGRIGRVELRVEDRKDAVNGWLKEGFHLFFSELHQMFLGIVVAGRCLVRYDQKKLKDLCSTLCLFPKGFLLTFKLLGRRLSARYDCREAASSKNNEIPIESDEQVTCEACRRKKVSCTHSKRQGFVVTEPPKERLEDTQAFRSRKRRSLEKAETEHPLNPQVPNELSRTESEAVAGLSSVTNVIRWSRKTPEAEMKEERTQESQKEVVALREAFQQAELRKSPQLKLEDKNLGQELSRLREQLTQQSDRILRLQGHNMRQGDQLKMQGEQLQRQQDLLKREKEKVAKQQESLNRQQNQLVRQEAVVRQAQEQKQCELQEARRARSSDENTRSKLETLAGAVQSFSRGNAMTSQVFSPWGRSSLGKRKKQRPY